MKIIVGEPVQTHIIQIFNYGNYLLLFCQATKEAD